jgi:hypothetical protein
MKTGGVPLQVVPEDGKLNPIMSLETRPSAFTGFSWWLVLVYKDHYDEKMLPPDFGGMDEATQGLVIAPLAEEMRVKLRPILIAEDHESRLVIPK